MDDLISTISKVRELQRKLYLKAKSEPKFRFYALYDKVYRLDVLWESWLRVSKNEGAPGIDKQTISDIEQQGIETFIKDIQDELKTGTYRPTPVRRVYIPKPDGSKRPLGIPIVKDRVVQMALKIVVEPIFEADFEDESYGYRPKRSAQQAVKEIVKYLNYGYDKVIDGDLKDCFSSIPHRELLNMIATRIVDKRTLKLIKAFLKAGVMEKGLIQIDDKGTPQGGVISPLLANIYLDKLDKGWKPQSKYTRLIRYADDFVILVKDKVNWRYNRLKELIEKLKLKVNEKKTRIVSTYRESFDFLGYTFKKKKNKGKYVAYFWPTKKAEKKIREKIKEVVNKRQVMPIEMVIPQLNAVIQGWVNYFKIGNSSTQFKRVRYYIEQRLRKFLMRRRHKVGFGYKEYIPDFLYRKLGLYANYYVSWTKAS